ncbi:MAG TPA: hemolysin III family protein [Chthoniobacterales bacterium]|nr:hemolysin III family protein [Chthoniobacterales bacterium]
MNERVTSEERRQSPGEELANAVSAGAGLIAAIAGTPLLFAFGTQRGSDWTVAGAAIFAATTVWLYLASTVYHALPRTRAKRLFRLFDHMGIFLLIAGTYTPFTLGALRGAGGWTLFAAVWSLAILGIGFTVFGGLRFRRLSVCIYLGLGWLALFAARPFWLHVPLSGLLWLVAGGIAYTAGVVFYLAKRLAYSHFIWHLFVIAGTSCHFCAVLWYAG